MQLQFLIIPIWFLLVINSFFDSCKGQRSGKPAGPKKPSKSKIKQVTRQSEGEGDYFSATRLQCLSCSTDFSSKRLDITDACYNPGSVAMDKIRHSLLTVCPTDSRYCRLEITRVAGVLSGIARGCGGTHCVDACFQRGYGTEVETCTQCCGGIHTNETDGDMDGPSSSDKFNCS
ncbi:hypothetical protein HDE_12019 [Halotydeus destructor]|nr:hypothetical protein HDE_12019 [Halotydeus destructor]